MRSLIVYAHPYEKSFNNHILNVVKEKLSAKNHIIDLIDLNEDGFNPVMTKADLKLFSKGEYADPLALDYVTRLKAADEVIFIYPIWWYGEPAILKGFFDKVFLKGHTYKEVNYQMVGLLNTKRAAVLTTSSIDRQFFKNIGDPIQNVFNGTLHSIGIKDVTWLHCSSVFLEESRNNFIKEVEEYFS